MLLHSAISMNKGLSSSKKNTVNILHSSNHAKNGHFPVTNTSSTKTVSFHYSVASHSYTAQGITAV